MDNSAAAAAAGHGLLIPGGLCHGIVPMDIVPFGWTAHIYHVLSCMLVLLLIDRLILLRFVCFADSKTRWWALHALANFAVAFAAVPDTVWVLQHPFCCMFGRLQSWLPSHLAFAVHAYHLAMFVEVKFEELAHHLLFVGVFGAVNFAFYWGPIVNVLLLFITGIPGGVNYVMLVLKKMGVTRAMDQKRRYALIDVWLRMPGLMFVATLMLSASIHKATRVPTLATLAVVLLSAFNGIFYMRQTLQDYYTKKTMASIRAAAADAAAAAS